MALPSSDLRSSSSSSGDGGNATNSTSTPRRSSSWTKYTDHRYPLITTRRLRTQCRSRTAAQSRWQGAPQAPTPPDKVSTDRASTPTPALRGWARPRSRRRPRVRQVRQARIPDMRIWHMTNHPHIPCRKQRYRRRAKRRSIGPSTTTLPRCRHRPPPARRR